MTSSKSGKPNHAPWRCFPRIVPSSWRTRRLSESSSRNSSCVSRGNGARVGGPAICVRPIHRQKEERIEAHICVAFLANCLQVTSTRRLKDPAPGLTARSVLEKLAAIQMIDVHLPTTDGREVILTRYTQPEPEQRLLLEKLKLTLPEQPPPKITARQLAIQ